MKNIIFVETVTQFKNAGDELINLSLIDQLRPKGQIVLNDRQSPLWYLERLMSSDDKLFSEYHGNGGFYMGILKKQLKQLFKNEREQYYIALPPGHFSQKGSSAAFGMFKLYIKLLLLKFSGVRIIRAGFSIGPFDKINEFVQRLGSKAFHLYGLRDTVTLKYSKTIGIKKSQLFPDMAWALNTSSYPTLACQQNKIAICFRSNAYGTDHSEEYLAPLMKSLDTILQSEAISDPYIVFCYQVEFDKEASKYMYEQLKHKYNCEFFEERLGIADAYALYSSSNFTISNRLHVLLLAAKAGSLPLALVNKKDNVKITSIFNDNGLQNCVLDLDSTNEELKSDTKIVIENKQQTMDLFEAKCRENTREMSNLIETTFK